MSRYRELDLADVWIDEYHFRKRLGAGAYAAVWLADECSVNRQVIRPVAAKVFVDDSADRSSFRQTIQAFQLDVSFLADLAPNKPIIQYYGYRMKDVILGDGGAVETMGSRPPEEVSSGIPLTAFFVIMEYADGGHLDRLYREEVILRGPRNSFLDHFIDLCTALQGAHENNVVHRDIKPHNILWFRKLSRVKIGDFGIAKYQDDIHPATSLSIAGALPYMSPESFTPGSPPTAQRDIYALGCTFYELLTGQPAVDPSARGTTVPDGFDEMLDLYRTLHSTANRPDAIMQAPDVVANMELNDIVKKMMQIDPNDRPSLEEVTAVLQNAKRRPVDHVTIADKVSTIDIPVGPTRHSEYYVNPRYRRKQLKETLFLVFISMPAQTTHKYKTLFALLESSFGNTFSLFELYGRYDILIRVWAPTTGIEISELCKRVIDHVLEDDRKALLVMPCESVVYLGTSRRNVPSKINNLEILVKLNEAQKDGGPSAIKWLKKNNIYVRQAPNAPISGPRVPCFCLISHAAQVAVTERTADFALILQELQKAEIDVKRRAIAAYSKAYQPIDGLLEEPSDYLISYVSATYDDVAAVPGAIVDRLAGHRLRTATLLASKRYFVESDMVTQR